MPNIFEPHFDAERDDDPYRWRRARLGRQAGMRELGASLFEVPPGAATFPLHIHHHNEEAIVVVSGRPTLRTLDGERTLEPGDVVACPAGRDGAHRLDNRTDEPVRVLVISTMLAPEVNEFPDEGTYWLRSFAPGHDGAEGDVDVMLRPLGERAD
jgi:uncharacterized cupin superfamily protein